MAESYDAIVIGAVYGGPVGALVHDPLPPYGTESWSRRSDGWSCSDGHASFGGFDPDDSRLERRAGRLEATFGEPLGRL